MLDTLSDFQISRLFGKQLSSSTLKKLPFVKGNVSDLLTSALLFLATVFRRSSEKAITERYAEVLSRFDFQRGRWPSLASTQNFLRALVVHPEYSKSEEVQKVASTLAGMQDRSGSWQRSINAYLTVNAPSHLDIKGDLRQKILTIFDRSFAITYAIEQIAILVSLIGVINTLLALALERKREISILRYLGGSWKQIREVFLIAAGIVGASGIIWGAALGALMSVILVKVVNTISFGWEIRFRIPALTLSLVMAALFIATLAAGLIPSKVAKQIDPKRFISFE